ncbi:putative secreted protein [Thalassoporum mexicanum PCC 7367]|uniref:ABC transporter substrate-binding protein n=1 Tax=Thalassoporum mexicanum TaxID=3457544 RepID=UPI00029FAB9E|nr:putative secreted protein [Pseudanabaena sp. PCC 7367]
MNRINNLGNLDRRQLLKLGSFVLGAGVLSACSANNEPAPSSSDQSLDQDQQLDKIALGLGWKAEAEYGGYYQAVATGIYAEYGLEVDVQETPPQANLTQMLMGGVIDFSLGNAVSSIKALQEGIPKVTIASIFQKEIQVLLAHPGVGNDSFEALKGKPIFLSPAVNTTYWPLLKSKYGYDDSQQRPYNFNIGPFLIDENSVQQGLLTAEPFTIAQEAGFDPVILQLAEAGYNPYSFTIDTKRETIAQKPDLVQRFVDASIKGWYSYLENPAPGNELIQKDNPEMSAEQIAYSIEKLKEYEVIKAGVATKLGIGAMTDDRWQSLYNELVEYGIVEAGLDYQEAYTLEFANKGVAYYQS